MSMTRGSRETIKYYKELVNERRRAAGQSPLTTPQILDEICDFMKHRPAVFIGGHYIQQQS